MNWFSSTRYSPIGVDIGSRSVKLVQYAGEDASASTLSGWDFPVESATVDANTEEAQIEAIQNALDGQSFHGRTAVPCLSEEQLFLQNIRIRKTDDSDILRQVHQEAAGKLPFPLAEAELRFLEADDVRQGSEVMREVIVMACHRPLLEKRLAVIEACGLEPVAVDVEPMALLRSYRDQFRRDNDCLQRAVLVHIGWSQTLVVIVEGDRMLFAKYLPVGGRLFSEAVASRLDMSLTDATALRRHSGDRRSDQQDPEIAQSVAEAMRPVVENLCAGLAKCVRYHSVTFRGKPLSRMVLGGGEASPLLLETIGLRLNLRNDLSEPFRRLSSKPANIQQSQWEIASGLALWNGA